MKKIFFPFSLIFIFLVIVTSTNSEGQIWKKIKKEVKNRTERKVVNKVGDATDKTIDEITTFPKGDKEKGNNENQVKNNWEKDQDEYIQSSAEDTIFVPETYSNYDFVPGDKIIFQPDFSKEADAELPARFMVLKGNAEINSYQGEKTLRLQPGGGITVAPMMNSDTYLPEQFTIEFDVMYEENEFNFKYHTFLEVVFQKLEGKRDVNSFYFTTRWGDGSVFGVSKSTYKAFPEDLAKSLKSADQWHHFAIYVNKNIGKTYIDGYRVNATNILPTGAGKIQIKGDVRYGFKIKNFRLAAGGDDKYQKIVTDGKFITHGILFDVNKSTIKPESMGALNEIVKLMKEHTDLKFEIGGHTDSDGNADANLKLSHERAKAVKVRLMEMDIAENRLNTQGFGEAKPISDNNSDEGKATNRRVEFRKI